SRRHLRGRVRLPDANSPAGRGAAVRGSGGVDPISLARQHHRRRTLSNRLLDDSASRLAGPDRGSWRSGSGYRPAPGQYRTDPRGERERVPVRANYPVTRIAIIGGGSWGTALACVLGPRFHGVALWFNEPDIAKRTQETRVNEVFLPG